MGEAPGAIINIPLMIILIAMLLLSLWRKDHPERRQSY
ncbi:putative membrane protein [Synechococcus sp. ROS8604]|nr:putative membrane protein [Synechococcus sp. ROS8604]